MNKDIFGIIIGVLVVVCVILGYSKFATNRPIIFENVNTALYDGMPYYQYNHGYTFLDKLPVYFRSYISLVANEAVITFRSKKESPIFCIIYTPGPNLAKDGRGWIDDNCDGKFRPLVITDEAEVPKCYKED